MNNIVLNIKDIVEIKELASETRQAFGMSEGIPIANDMRMLLNKQGIILCEYPFADDSRIDAEIVRFEMDDKPLIFIGLNSSLYYDEQIFALAHEIYHFKTRTGKAFSDKDIDDIKLEKKADRFAAELLLPEGVLKKSVVMEFGGESISDTNILRVLRFIASLQSCWWLPYRSIVLRLLEEKLIDQLLFDRLYKYDPRNEEDDYYKILNAVDSNIAKMLNSKTEKISVSNKVIDAIIRNYEDGYISEDDFVSILEVFKISPSDYGYDMESFDFDEDYNTED